MQFKTIIVSLLVITIMFSLPVASARPVYFEAFKQQYNTEDTDLDTCNTCHINPNGGGTRNPYGVAYHENDMDFVSIESLDSDNDEFTNIEEINALTLPGNPDDFPDTVPEAESQISDTENDPSESQDAEDTNTSINENSSQETTEESSDGPISKQQAPGFGAALTITGILATIYWFRK